MKVNFNPDYIEYKVLFTSTYYQQINKNLFKLFIKFKDQTYFPEFIVIHINYYSLYDEVCIRVERIPDIIDELLDLIRGEHNESES